MMSSEPKVASAARVYDFLLGGTHNHPVDQAAGTQLLRTFPLAAIGARYNREFLKRTVRYLVEQGVRQFLDLGSGIPTAGNVHEIAQAAAPGARVVYVDYEPEAAEEGRRLLADNRDAAFLYADLCDPEAVFGSPEVRRLLDFTRPVGLLMISVLHFVSGDEAAELVRRYRERLVPGSYFALTHLASPKHEPRVRELQEETTRVYNSTVSESLASRTPEQIMEFFAGLELAPPGLVPVPDWRPEDPDYVPDPDDEARNGGLGGVARVP